MLLKKDSSKMSEIIPTVKVVGLYTCLINKELGHGSFGAVYLGYHEKNPEIPLAIKKIPIPEDSNFINLEKSLSREIRILKNIVNQNIVKLYDALLTQNNIYLVYEHCDGGDLEQFRKATTRKYLSEAQTMVIFKNFCHGYRLLFDNEICHRDIKPANVFLHEGVVKIGDFGCAKKDNEKLMTQGTGTPLYMSPECYHSIDYDSKTDVWSFGIMIFELLYGSTPWTGKNSYDLFANNIGKKKLKFPEKPERSMKIKSLIARMLIIEKKERISWEEIFKEVLSFEKEEKINNLSNEKTERIIKKKKPVIGLVSEKLFEDITDKNINEKNKKIEEKEKNELEETKTQIKNTNNNYKLEIFINKKNQINENHGEVKKQKEIIFYNRNLASFFGNCSYLLNQIREKNLISIDEKLFDQIIGCFYFFESQLIEKARSKLADLSKCNILKLEELVRLNNDLAYEENEIIPNFKKNPCLKNLKKFLKLFLENLNDLFSNKQKVLRKEKKYDNDFFKFILFSCILMKIDEFEEILTEDVKPEEIIVEAEKEISQAFYFFYDKYDSKDKNELISDISERLKEINKK